MALIRMALTHSMYRFTISIRLNFPDSRLMSDRFPARRNPRIKGYDYSQEGYYFITICSKNRQEIFSKITDGKLELTEIGRVIEYEWQRSSEIRKEIELDSFVIMPNHLHAIVRITKSSGRLHARGLEKGSIPSLITGFKSSVTKSVRLRELGSESPWQRGYYEHIIRDEQELMRIREYIALNPKKWEYDRENFSRLIERMILR